MTEFSIFTPGNPLNFPLVPLSEQVGAKPFFGRLQLKDPRSDEYPLEAHLPRKLSTSEKKMNHRKWRGRWHGNQGSTSYCTAYSLLHLWEMEPINHPRSYGQWKGKPMPIFSPRELYCEAQAIDPWPGGCGKVITLDAYDGTSVTAMMQVAKNRGMISEYAWEYKRIENVIEYLMHVGPVIAGTNWYDGMMLPEKERKSNPQALLNATGSLVGGHAYVLDEIDLRKSRKGFEIGVFQSWEDDWGLAGRAYMSIETLERLMLEDGEICLVKENP